MSKFQMRLTCTFTLSRDAEDAKEAIADLIREANEVILLKGVPKGKEKEGARIIEWNLEKDQLQMMIVSGTYVRAPAAVLRMRKAFREKLGRTLKLGIRKLMVSNFDTIIPLPAEVPSSVLERIKKIHGVSSAFVEEGKLVINFTPLYYSDLKKGIVDRVLRLIEVELKRVVIKPPAVPIAPLVRQGRRKRVKFREDPAKVALELGWIREFPGRGQWIYSPPFATLQETIEEILIEEVAHKLGFQPCLIPKLIPFKIMENMPGYFENMPEGMYYVCPPPREPEAFDYFKELFRATREVPVGELRKVLKDPRYVLAPAQCEPFWFYFSRKTLDLDELPIKFYDRSGWTYRWEGGGVEGLVRVHEFKRIELAYFGSPEDVVKIRDSVLDENIRVADKLLDLEWRIVPDIPFWAREWEPIVDVHESYKVPAYDLEVYLPYRGPRKKAEWLEISACFIHRDVYVRSFKIRERKGREIWTGCTGMGVTRWTAAFLARHGFNYDDWPSYVKAMYGKYKSLLS